MPSWPQPLPHARLTCACLGHCPDGCQDTAHCRRGEHGSRNDPRQHPLPYETWRQEGRGGDAGGGGPVPAVPGLSHAPGLRGSVGPTVCLMLEGHLGGSTGLNSGIISLERPSLIPPTGAVTHPSLLARCSCPSSSQLSYTLWNGLFSYAFCLPR